MSDDMPRQVDSWVDPDDVMAALLRAARRAHEIARDTGTKVVVVVDGETVKMDPNPEMFDGLEPGRPLFMSASKWSTDIARKNDD